MVPKSLSKIFLFVLVAVASFAASASPHCPRVFDSDSSLNFQNKTTTVKGQEVQYKFAKLGREFVDLHKIPGAENALVINFAWNGHVSLHYKSTRVEGHGQPPIYIKSEARKNSKAAFAGVSVVIRDLPPEFAARWLDHVENFEPSVSRTCVQSACRSLKQVEVPEVVDRTYYSPTALLNHLAILSLKREGTDIYVFDKSFGEHYAVMKRTTERGQLAGGFMTVNLTTLAWAVIELIDSYE